MRLVALVPLLFVIDTQLAGCSCGSIGCTDGAQITVDTSIARDQLAGGRVRLCRKTTCTDVDLADLQPTTYRENQLPSAISVSVSVSGAVSIWADAPSDGELSGGLTDGDVYTLELWSASGGALASYRWEAMYVEAHAGGMDCAPLCRTTQLDNANAL